MENYPNRTNTHNLKNLALIAEAKKTIRRNIGISNVYMFLYADFDGVEFYVENRYVHLKKEGREEDLFVIYEYEE